MNRYVLIQCSGGLTITDIDNNYNKYPTLTDYIFSMMRLNEKRIFAFNGKRYQKN